MVDRPTFPCPRCTDPGFCAMEDCRHGIADTPDPDAMTPVTPPEAVAFDIVARLRRGICADVCRFQNAASGCECAEAADEIVLLRAELELYREAFHYDVTMEGAIYTGRLNRSALERARRATEARIAKENVENV